MDFNPSEVAIKVYGSYPPSRVQLLKLMRRHTVRQIVFEYMVKHGIELGKDSTHVDDVTNKLWDSLHP